HGRRRARPPEDRSRWREVPEGAVRGRKAAHRGTLAFFQSGDRRFLEEQAGAAGLPGIEVIEDRAERLVVELDGARTGPAADGPTRIVELNGMLRVPRLAIVARDDEMDLLTACAWTNDFRGNNPA